MGACTTTAIVFQVRQRHLTTGQLYGSTKLFQGQLNVGTSGQFYGRLLVAANGYGSVFQVTTNAPLTRWPTFTTRWRQTLEQHDVGTGQQFLWPHLLGRQRGDGTVFRWQSRPR